jgi:glycosyltransferase involved in cell wall biosynthesis
MTRTQKTPAVSVVIATRNRANLLSAAVNSILGQTFQDFEIVLVDDASCDATPSVAEKLAREEGRIRVFRSDTNIGPGAARNLGVSQAQGELVAIMDDDDVALPERLEIQAHHLADDPALGLVFSSVAWVTRDKKVMNVFPGVVKRGEFPSTPDRVFALLYLESNKIPNTTVCVRRKIISEQGYPPSPWIGEDWFWCMQLAASGVKMQAINDPLVHVARDAAIPGLMGQRTRAMQSQRQVLRMIRAWLREKGIRGFDSLHRAAWANQLVREARNWSGLKGLLLCSYAAVLAPTNTKAQETLSWLLGKAFRKTGLGRP